MRSSDRTGAGTTKRARRGPLGAAAVALAALAAFPVAGTWGATDDAAGWWSRTASPLPVNPTAPHVEEGQLHVQGEPEGPTAVAAVRFTLSDDESEPVLTVVPADGSLVPPDAVLRACRAAAPWQEAHGGAWDEAPEADCATAVDGVVAEDGESIELSLGALLEGTTLDVVLLPGETPSGGGSMFSLTFDRPTAADLATTSTSSFESSGSFTPDAGGGGGSTDPAPAPAGGGSGSFTAPPTASPSVSPPPGDVAMPEAPPVEEGQGEVEQAAPPPSSMGTARPASSGSSPAADRARNLGIVVLLAGAAVVGWAWMASGQAGQAAGTAAVERRDGPALGRRSGGRLVADPNR